MILWICKGLFRLSWDISLWKQPLQDSSGCAAPYSSMTQVATGPTHNATVLHAGIEVGGFPSAGLFGRKRLHGGEDEGKTVRNILIWGTGQSRCMSYRRSTEEKHLCLARCEEFWYRFLRNIIISPLPSSSIAMTAAPLLSNTCTTVARPFLAAM